MQTAALIVAVVAHATAMGTFLCHLMGKPLREIWAFFPPYGSVAELGWDGEFHLGRVGIVPARSGKGENT